MSRTFLTTTMSLIGLLIIINFLWFIWSTNQKLVINFGDFFMIFLLCFIIIGTTTGIFIALYFFRKNYKILCMLSCLSSLMSMAQLTFIYCINKSVWTGESVLKVHQVLGFLNVLTISIYAFVLFISKSRKEFFLKTYGVTLSIGTVILTYFFARILIDNTFKPNDLIEEIAAYISCFAPLLLVLNVSTDLKRSRKRYDLLDS